MTEHLPYEATEDEYLEEANARYDRLRSDADEAFDEADDVDRRDDYEEFAGIAAAWLVTRQREAGLRPSSTIPSSPDDHDWFDRHVYSSYLAGRSTAREAMSARGINPPRTPGVRASTTHQNALQSAYERQRTHWRRLSKDLRSEVKQSVRESLRDGATMREAHKTIDDRLVKTGKDRAMRIARTEPARAFNHAMVAEYQDSGVRNVAVDVSWETVGDGRVCEECMAMAGTYAVGRASEMLRSGNFPPHPLCRCLLMPE